MYIKLPEKASCTGNGAKKPERQKNPEAKKPVLTVATIMIQF